LPGHFYVVGGFEMFGKKIDLCGRPSGQYGERKRGFESASC
jgi:hypothetical protein